MAKRLEGKLALVTGGSRGIGAAIAEAYAREGARVVIASRRQEGLDQTAAAINERYPGAVVARACHVGHTDQVQGLIDFIDSKLGALDVLVNNAGTNPYFGPMLGISEELFDKTFQVNLKGIFEPTRYAVSKWMDAEKAGSVISIASIAGIQAAPLQGVYGMTKAAIISMTKTLAVELGSLGIRVNAIAPGLIDTRLSAALTSSAEIVKVFTDHTALKRYGQPGEIAELAVYLGSDESSFVTGQTFCVDGGYTIT